MNDYHAVIILFEWSCLKIFYNRCALHCNYSWIICANGVFSLYLRRLSDSHASNPLSTNMRFIRSAFSLMSLQFSLLINRYELTSSYCTCSNVFRPKRFSAIVLYILNRWFLFLDSILSLSRSKLSAPFTANEA